MLISFVQDKIILEKTAILSPIINNKHISIVKWKNVPLPPIIFIIKQIHIQIAIKTINNHNINPERIQGIIFVIICRMKYSVKFCYFCMGNKFAIEEINKHSIFSKLYSICK